MKKIIITVILAVIIGACGWGLIENSRLNISKAEGFESDKILDKSYISEVINYSVRGDSFYQEADDPRFFVTDFYMKLESLKIVLKEPLEKNTLICKGFYIYSSKPGQTGPGLPCNIKAVNNSNGYSRRKNPRGYISPDRNPAFSCIYNFKITFA